MSNDFLRGFLKTHFKGVDCKILINILSVFRADIDQKCEILLIFGK